MRIWEDLAIALVVALIVVVMVGGILFGSVFAWTYYGTGPCAWRGGVDSLRSLYTPGKTVCANGEVR